MNKLQPILICLFLLIFPFFGKSQNMNIQGTVYDSTGVNPLKNAVVMAVRIKDSLLLGFSHSDLEGKFTMNDFPIDTFSLVITYPKYDDKTYLIFGHSANYEINIPRIKLQPDSKELEAVIIYANKNPIFYKGDTLVYVADSFKVAENAVVEDLLRKLPGIHIEKDGKIKSQGKSIEKVFVDGDEFFGGDATIATKNLAANGIESVEVYEKKNESATEGEAETIQVMNLKLKEEAKKGYFGRTSLASDFSNYYQGELLANKFNGTQKISIYALGSNTPKSSFGWSDENKFGLDNENTFVIDDNGNYSMTRVDNPGIPQTFKTGIYFSDKIGKKKNTKFKFNYGYAESRRKSDTKSRSQYFLTDTTYFLDDTSHVSELKKTNNFGFSFDTKLDSLTTLTISPKIIYNTTSDENLSVSKFSSQNQELTRKNTLLKSNELKGVSFENQVYFSRNFKKAKRELTIDYFLSVKKNESTGKFLSQNIYFDNSNVSDTTDQAKINNLNSQDHNVTLRYVEPLTKKLNLELEYLLEYNLSDQKKETRNKVDGLYDQLNALYSNNFTNQRRQNRAGASLIYRIKKYTISGGAKIRNIDILNHNLISGSVIHQNVNSILPRAAFVYNPSNNKRISLRYSTKTDQPSVIFLQPVNDNTNPNNIRIGNPNLKPSYTHSINASSNIWEALSNRYLYTQFSVNLTNNAFVNSMVYDPLIIGRMTTQTVNTNGNISGNFYVGGGMPIYKKVIRINPGINGNYSNIKSYINNELNRTINKSISGALSIDFNKDSLKFSLGTELAYTSPSSSISSVSNTPYTTNSYTSSFTWIFPWKMKIISDATYTMNGKRADGYNINYLIWNAEINRSFLKTENLIFSLIGNDILNQNISAKRYVSSNVITDNKTKIISRYFLVKLTLKFNNNKTKEEDEEGW